MNANFINIKVDREERPVSTAIHAGGAGAEGQGGWQ